MIWEHNEHYHRRKEFIIEEIIKQGLHHKEEDLRRFLAVQQISVRFYNGSLSQMDEHCLIREAQEKEKLTK